MAKKKRTIFLLSNPISPEREQEFNDWYENVIAKNVARLPGFVGIKRYRASELQMWDKQPSYRYVAVYTIADMEKFKAAMHAAHADFPKSDCGDFKNAVSMTFEEIFDWQPGAKKAKAKAKTKTRSRRKAKAKSKTKAKAKAKKK
jgi:hypothetical protein